MPEVTLSDLISIRGRFIRSVHLERDYRDASGRGYYLTESACQILGAVAGALANPTDRAMTLIGPYGAGKSAFCLYLAQLLADESRNRLASVLGSVQGGGNGQPHPTPRLLPIPLVGARQPLALALVTGLMRALQKGKYARLAARLRSEYGDIFNNPSPTPRQVADLYQQAAVLARIESADGVLLIIDELGKFLEYAALHPRDEDIFTLQELAEASARSGDAPLLVMGVLHQHADAYAQRLGHTHQAEWAKIGERFRQIPFFPSDLESIEMVGRALQRDPSLQLDGRVDHLSRCWTEITRAHNGWRERFVAIARDAYPLHPITLLALPPLFRKAGQSHRSLFSFLAGEEPHALGRFLRETPIDDTTNLPLFMPDALFDYAAEVLLGGWSGSALTRLWAEAVESVERAPDLSLEGRRVLKCIALFGLLKDPRLPASEAMLSLALTGCGGLPPDVPRALTELKQRRLVVYSRARGAYRLWEGGDIDVEAELANDRSALPAGTTVHVATALCPPARLIARRHSYETGTLRVVSIRPCGALQIKDAISEAGEQLSILCCLAANPEEAQLAEEEAQKLDQPNLLVIVATETDTLREAAADVAAAHRVEKEAVGLQSDRAARRELAARLAEAEAAFRAEWARLFGPSPEAAAWFFQGQPVTITGARAFSAFLSRMADATYPCAPYLRNELINRQALSSAAAAGRRSLIEAMLTRPSEERLGIEGYPPELSMYECLLRATGLHRVVGLETWEFGSPPAEDPARLRPSWAALENIVFADPPEPRPVTAIFRTLGAPPYGITEGVLPVLLCAFLLANSKEVTLYREGTFITELEIADFEVLMRRPELFAVAGCRVTGARAAVVERLASGLGAEAAVVPVVRALFRMVKGLPDHAWKTRQLPPTVLRLRDAFLRARSPERLLFQELPAALGEPVVDAGMDAAAIEHLFELLNAALQRWAAATPTAIATVRDALLESCGMPAGDGGWSALVEQAPALAMRTTHPRLSTFLHRAATPGDGQSALESVLAFLADKPSRNWTDEDVRRCRIEARNIGELFRKVASDMEPMKGLTPAEQEEARRVKGRLQASMEDISPRVLRAALAALLADLESQGSNYE